MVHVPSQINGMSASTIALEMSTGILRCIPKGDTALKRNPVISSATSPLDFRLLMRRHTKYIDVLGMLEIEMLFR